MKLVRGVVWALVWFVAMPLWAEGPDDLFVRAYSLMQQGDALQAGGQGQAARDRYQEARSLLMQLRTTYPSWNEKIVSYRIGYISERVGGPASGPGGAAAEDRKPAPPAEGVGTEGSAAGTTTSLAEEIKQLRAEREALQARLKEALTAQPAAVDPRELARAEERVRELEREIEGLRQRALRVEEKPVKAGDTKALAEAQKALKDARADLKRQTQEMEDLTRKNQALQQDLKKAMADAEAKRVRGSRSGSGANENAAVTKPEPGMGLEEVKRLTEQLKRAQDESLAQRARLDVVQAENATLKKRIDDLLANRGGAAKGTNAAPVPEVAAAVVPAPEKPVSNKASRAAEKVQIKELERERDDLRKRVAALTRELQDRRMRPATTQKDRLAEELSVLRARIEVYEARKVPYSTEELTLFRQTAKGEGVGQVSTTKKTSRQVPAGAAALVAEAQRAFQGRRLDEAEKKFQQALVLDDRNLGLLTDLAATHLEQNRLDAAEATLNRAMAADANDAEVLSLLGLLRFRQAKYEEALDVLSRSARLNPDNPLTQNYLGVTLSQKGQRGPAETAFRKAIQLEPGYAEAHYNLAVVYAHQTPPFPELARWHYKKALAGGQPRNPELEKTIEGIGGEAAPK
jgi:Flp pilus assembly protein TadD